MRLLSGVVLRTQADGILLALAANGSEPAFEALVQRYRRPLQAYCRRLLVSDARSEDVVQQALLNAWQALRAGTEVREPRAWLYRITHNLAISALRRPEFDFSELEDSLQAADAPESDLERRTLMRETLAAVAALPGRQQEVILRTAVEGQSYEQVAAALGMTSGAVRGLAHRARTSLRAAVAAVVPSPAVVWAAERARPTGTGPAWIELLTGGGGVGGAAAVVKSATLLASTAAIVGGTVSGVIKLPLTSSGHHSTARHHPPTPRSRRHPTLAALSASATTSSSSGQAAGSIARSPALGMARAGASVYATAASSTRRATTTTASAGAGSFARPQTTGSATGVAVPAGSRSAETVPSQQAQAPPGSVVPGGTGSPAGGRPSSARPANQAPSAGQPGQMPRRATDLPPPQFGAGQAPTAAADRPPSGSDRAMQAGDPFTSPVGNR